MPPLSSLPTARSAGGGSPGSPEVAPGRRTLTERLAAGRRGGRALPGGVRARFEGSLGTDLGQVRVHDDDASAAEADALGARAFAYGDDVHFAAGAYQPDDPFGMHLLAHEVAHTVAQRGAAPAPQGDRGAASVDAAAERDADRAADAMVRGAPARVAPVATATVQCWSADGAPGPTPAPPTAPAPEPVGAAPAAVSGDEAAPVVLPEHGPLAITFSSGPRQMPLDLGDLRSLDLGRGRLISEPLPIGEFISIQAELGAATPMTLTKPTFTLSPVVGTISAAEVEPAAARDRELSRMAKGAGAIAAANGGILGGLAGLLTGRDPKASAEAGGAAAGSAVAGLVQRAGGEHHLLARLDQGEVSADIGLVYNPYVGLSVSGTGLSWLANAHAWLQTHLRLNATAAASLAGSEVVLVFRGGTLVRTEFTLRPTLRFGLHLAGHAALEIGATLLPILSGPGVPHYDEGVLQGNLILEPFPLVDWSSEVVGGAELVLSKGSPLTVRRRGLHVPERAAGDAFGRQLRASARAMPFQRQRGDLDHRSRTGRSRADAIPMVWAKPFHGYPDYLRWHPMSGPSRRIPKFPYDDHSLSWEAGPSMGVSYYPAVGDRLPRTGAADRGDGVRRWRQEATNYRVDLADLGYDVDIDHVQDLEFGGSDTADNLWPLDRGGNRAAGSHNKQRVWWAPDRSTPPRRTRILETPLGRWFEIERIDPRGLGRID